MIRFILILFVCSLGYGQVVNNPFITFSGCTPLANNLRTEGNATSDANCNETNGIVGITVQDATVTSSTENVDVGTYAIKIVATATTGAFAAWYFTVVSGRTYDFHLRVNNTVGTNAIVHTVAGGSLVTGDPFLVAVADSGWETHTYTMTATGGGLVGIGAYASQNGSIDDVTFADDVYCVETIP